MADLLVRGIDDDVVQALKLRAVTNRRSAEAEHRAILADALSRPKRLSLAAVLAAMPNVGLDADFERPAAPNEAARVFD